MLQRQFNAKITKLYHEFLENVLKMISETDFQINGEQKVPDFMVNNAQDCIMDLATQHDVRGSLLNIVAESSPDFKKSVKKYQKMVQRWSEVLCNLFNNAGLEEFTLLNLPHKQYKTFTQTGEKNVLYRFFIGFEGLGLYTKESPEEDKHFLVFDTVDRNLQAELGAFIPYSKMTDKRWFYYIDNEEQFKFLVDCIKKVL